LRACQLNGKGGDALRKAPKKLIKPCTTRWSSRVSSSERLIELEPCVELVDPQGANFWSNLKEMVQLLLPFRVATDVVQRDNANLYTVAKEFRSLVSHYRSRHWQSRYGVLLALVFFS
jgi:hypothetical protein